MKFHNIYSHYYYYYYYYFFVLSSFFIFLLLLLLLCWNGNPKQNRQHHKSTQTRTSAWLQYVETYLKCFLTLPVVCSFGEGGETKKNTQKGDKEKKRDKEKPGEGV